MTVWIRYDHSIIGHALSKYRGAQKSQWDKLFQVSYTDTRLHFAATDTTAVVLVGSQKHPIIHSDQNIDHFFYTELQAKTRKRTTEQTRWPKNEVGYYFQDKATIDTNAYWHSTAWFISVALVSIALFLVGGLSMSDCTLHFQNCTTRECLLSYSNNFVRCTVASCYCWPLCCYHHKCTCNLGIYSHLSLHCLFCQSFYLLEWRKLWHTMWPTNTIIMYIWNNDYVCRRTTDCLWTSVCHLCVMYVGRACLVTVSSFAVL